MAFPKENRADMQWARSQARLIAKRRPSADVYFRSLPNKRSLTALLADSSIWVSYYTGETQRGCYYYQNGYHEIGLSYFAFRTRDQALGTLLHELAHAGGAPGDTSQAESALIHCGLGTMTELRSGIDDPKTPYRPGIIG